MGIRAVLSQVVRYIEASQYLNLKKLKAVVNACPLAIFLAEDNQLSLDHMVSALRDAGHTVDYVSDGEKALDMLLDRGNDYDVAVLDYNLPGLTGLEIIRAYKFAEHDSTLPIIILTADATPERREQCIRAGASNCLTKPATVHDILAALDGVTNIKTEEPIDVADTPLLNIEKINKQAAHPGGLDSIADMFDTFARVGQESIDKLRECQRDNDHLEFRLELHTLGGASAYVGAPKLHRLCTVLQKTKLFELQSRKVKYSLADIQNCFTQTIKSQHEYLLGKKASRSFG